MSGAFIGSRCSSKWALKWGQLVPFPHSPIDCLPNRLAFEMSFVSGIINWVPKLTMKEGVFSSPSYRRLFLQTHTPYPYPCLWVHEDGLLAGGSLPPIGQTSKNQCWKWSSIIGWITFIQADIYSHIHTASSKDCTNSFVYLQEPDQCKIGWTMELIKISCFSLKKLGLCLTKKLLAGLNLR